MQKYTYILLLNWNSYEDTIECLKSIFNARFSDTKIVVIDNDSSDASIQNISHYLGGEVLSSTGANYELVDETSLDSLSARLFSSPVTIVKNKGNYGFGKGNNIVIRALVNQDDCGYVWLLNNDTVVEQSTLPAMLQQFEEPIKTGIVASVIQYYDNPTVIQNMGAKYYPLLGMSKLYKKGSLTSDIVKMDKSKIEKDIDYVSGASLLITPELFKEIGFFDERFFLYSEEQDLIYRAKQAGWRVSYAMGSFVKHKVSNSTKNRRYVFYYHLNKSNILFLKKHYSIWVTLSAAIFVISKELFVSWNFKYIKAVYCGISDAFLNR